MKIIFHDNQLSFRGTSNAVYDYALYNQLLLNNESVIIYNRNNKNNLTLAIKRFEKEFNVIAYDTINELEEIVEKENADLFYAIKAGQKDEIEVKNCKTAIHSVFKHYEPHGDVYAYVSEWLSSEMTQGRSPYVPHMITVEESKDDLRKELNIPKDAIVFGRHGGGNTFDIKFAKAVVKNIAVKRKDIYFLFMGTNDFLFRHFFRPYKNIIFLPPSVDKHFVAKFINTCDAYLHARKQGESFGIAIGEFSIKNKPIITWKSSPEKSHLEILGDKAIIYEDKKDLKNILNDFKPNQSKDWDAYSKNFNPKTIMKRFKQVFVDSSLR